jgi:hypothetical protein
VEDEEASATEEEESEVDNETHSVGYDPDREVHVWVEYHQAAMHRAARRRPSLRIVMAACGGDHSVVVSAEGRVWTFGCTLRGILGHNYLQDRLVPRRRFWRDMFLTSKIVTLTPESPHGPHHGRADWRAVGVGQGDPPAPAGPGRHQGWRRRWCARSAEGPTGPRCARLIVGVNDGDGCGRAVCDDNFACGRGAQAGLGLNDCQHRLVPTRVGPQHFANEPISAVAAGECNSAADGPLHLGGQGEAGNPGSLRCPAA